MISASYKSVSDWYFTIWLYFCSGFLFRRNLPIDMSFLLIHSARQSNKVREAASAFQSSNASNEYVKNNREFSYNVYSYLCLFTMHSHVIEKPCITWRSAIWWAKACLLWNTAPDKRAVSCSVDFQWTVTNHPGFWLISEIAWIRFILRRKQLNTVITTRSLICALDSIIHPAHCWDSQWTFFSL